MSNGFFRFLVQIARDWTGFWGFDGISCVYLTFSGIATGRVMGNGVRRADGSTAIVGNVTAIIENCFKWPNCHLKNEGIFMSQRRYLHEPTKVST